MRMRRASDTRDTARTGEGRRARDRLLTGEAPVAVGDTDLQHQLLFLGDELREAALAVAGIEQFLVRAQALLSHRAAPSHLRALLHEVALDDQVESLDDALTAVRRSLAKLVEP